MADSDRRLALNFITRSSNQARRRMRNILSGVAKSEETDVATERGKIFKRFVVDDGSGGNIVQEIVMEAARAEWDSDEKLTAEHDSIDAACEANFPLTSQSHGFWTRVRKRAEAHPDCPDNVFGQAKRASADNHQCQLLVEDAIGEKFARREISAGQQMAIKHPDGWSVLVPNVFTDYDVETRESDLEKVAYGEIHVDEEDAVAMAPFQWKEAGDLVYDPATKKYFHPECKLPEPDLTEALSKGKHGSLVIGVERQMLTDESVKNWVRMLHPRALATQWCLLHADDIEGDGDTTIDVDIEPWIDVSNTAVLLAVTTQRQDVACRAQLSLGTLPSLPT